MQWEQKDTCRQAGSVVTQNCFKIEHYIKTLPLVKLLSLLRLVIGKLYSKFYINLFLKNPACSIRSLFPDSLVLDEPK